MIEALTGIISSQSRYILQSQYLLDVDGLITNTSNKNGIVDASNNISQINNISHRNIGFYINSTVSTAPVLSADFFGANKNGVLFTGSEYMQEISPFAPNYNDEFWIGIKFSTSEPSLNPIYMGSIGEGAARPYGIQFGLFQSKILFNNIVRTVSDPISEYIKSVQTVNTFDDGLTHTVVIHQKLNDWKIYVDGIEESYVFSRNDSFPVDATFYNTGNATLQYGKWNREAQFLWVGALGNFIIGKGAPNLRQINRYL